MNKTLFALILLAFLAPMAANAKSAGVTVIELFTSQGCPACPPADALFQTLAGEDDDIIALGCHVTYFDKKGFRDELSRIFCDARQISYEHAGVLPKIYTPAAVINGQTAAIANRENELRSALNSSGRVRPLGLAVNAGHLDIYLPSMYVDEPVDVWLFGYDNARSGYGRRGAMTYANPVTQLTKLLAWDGKGANLSFPLDEFRADSYAVIAQRQNGEIIAAGKTRKLTRY